MVDQIRWWNVIVANRLAYTFNRIPIKCVKFTISNRIPIKSVNFKLTNTVHIKSLNFKLSKRVLISNLLNVEV